jgi:hypothetical protein
MEIIRVKTKVIRISKEPFLLHIVIDQNNLENVEYLKCLSNMITNDAGCTLEIISGIAIEKAAFSRNKNFSLKNWT